MMKNARKLNEKMANGVKQVVTCTNIYKNEYNSDCEYNIKINEIRNNLPKNKNLMLFHNTYLIVENRLEFNTPTFYKELIEQFGGVVEEIGARSFIATWDEYTFCYAETERHEYRGIVTKAPKETIMSYVKGQEDVYSLIHTKFPFKVWKAEYAGFVNEFLNLVLGDSGYFRL